jgi:CRP-like cAMP-binding protein
VGVASGTRRGRPCAFADRSFPKGSVIYAQSDPISRAWYVKRGAVALRDGPGDGDDNGVTAVRFEGALIGLEMLVTNQYLDTAIACTDTVLCGIDYDGLDLWLGAPNTPARTTLELALKTQVTELRRKQLRQGGALRRTAAWLRDEAGRLSSIGLRRAQVADLLNMRPETLSRVFARLREMGAVEVGRKHLDVIDPELLDAIAEGRVGSNGHPHHA